MNNRRLFLRAAGVALALPVLECYASSPGRRMLLISNNLGVLPKPFFPQTVGRDFSEITIFEFVTDGFGNTRMATRAIFREHQPAPFHRAVTKLRLQIG